MRSRLLVVGAVLILTVVTGVLIYQGNTEKATASSGTSSTTSGGVYAEDTADPTIPEVTAPGERPGTNVPMNKLEPGDTPPQFIIFSFDGAGSHQRWNEFMSVADESNSRFTGFLSGIYLLGDAGKYAGAYTGPGHKTGAAAIGYGGPESEIVTEVNDLNTAYMKGHEIGTHYNGHFCDDAPPGGNQWTTADWNDELDQFYKFVENWKTINGYTDAPDLIVPPESIKGGRTPCLTGSLDTLIPAWKAHGMTYDSSMPAPRNGIYWPQKVDGIWEFYMPQVYSPGFEGMTTAMDYNFWAKFNGAPGRARHRTRAAVHRQGHLRVHVRSGLQRQPGADPDRQSLQQVERRLVQPAGHGLHAGEVRPAGRHLRHLPGRHRLDGHAGPGRAAGTARSGARGGQGPGRGLTGPFALVLAVDPGRNRPSDPLTSPRRLAAFGYGRRICPSRTAPVGRVSGADPILGSVDDHPARARTGGHR